MKLPKFNRKAKNRPDVTEFQESQYSVNINGSVQWFNSKAEMLEYIEAYSKLNTIYQLSMLRFDIYNLLK